MNAPNPAKVGFLAGAFVDHLFAELTDAQLSEVKRRNVAHVSDGVCASHDFCDANMVMEAAFKSCFGREPDMQSDDDIALWNEAWDMAKSGWLTDSPLRDHVLGMMQRLPRSRS